MANSHLPEEIMEEILSLLPVKWLFRFKRVCRSWRSLIGSERFIKTHLRNSREGKTLAPHMLIIPEPEFRTSKLNCYSLHSLTNEDLVPRSSPLGNYPTYFPVEGNIVGCFDGIVCIATGGHDSVFSLWNPSTRTLIRLPEIGPDNPYVFDWRCSFGWDESSGAYKVFAFVKSFSGEFRGEIYSSDSNTWTTVPFDVTDIYGCGTFLHGNLHFVRSCPNSFDEIISFGLKSQVIGVIECPCNHGFARVVRGCLSMLHLSEEYLEFWIMKEYGVKESWMKLMTLSYMDFMFLNERDMIAYVDVFVCILDDQGPNREYKSSYNSKKKAILQLKNIKDSEHGVHLFFESLVSLDSKQEI